MCSNQPLSQKTSMIRIICQFLWCESLHHGPFQATNVTSLNRELGRVSLWANVSCVAEPAPALRRGGPGRGLTHQGPWVRTHWHTGLPRSQRRRHRSMPLPETGRARTAHCTALPGWGGRALHSASDFHLPLTGCGRAGTGQPQREHPAQGQNPRGPQPLPHLVPLVLSHCREKQIGVWELTCPRSQCWGRRPVGKNPLLEPNSIFLLPPQNLQGHI